MSLRLCIIVALVLLMQGCGRKGSLYMPTAAPIPSSIPASSAVPNTQAVP
ncbi:MAG: LPS translocon maturation chaperone LptM [Gallionella sp.]